ncbi:MAG: PadR family transcriptional regulator [Clostridium sp.]|uniref:PadR family transcriptional regulator n=1 Tax=Clostridium sp. LY3-2 TaxID=2942482 RepID=UPI002152B5CC|nr:PadR family transcriptional regulator [Clostridium sp. LY3-2]MCR6515662.1 PadR family transcriptional regulator [Clostridium sp. LY3-2]
MNNNSQMLKGILEGCILQIINTKKETYGYEIVSEIQHYGFKDISEGTIYPLLTRLQKGGLLNSIKKPSPLGPNRKYYSITNEGLKELKDFKETWIELNIFVSNILN